jgi:hypothetical protein
MASWKKTPERQCNSRTILSAALASCVFFSSGAYGQTASTGALAGSVLDPSGAVISGVEVQLISQTTGEIESVTSDNTGFAFPLLAPGAYELQASKNNFETLRISNLNVFITETLRLELRLQLATILAKAEVSSQSPVVQTDTIALGRVANQALVVGLPLVTRNFAQITALSPGVATGVSNAGELGPGGTGLPQIDKSDDGFLCMELAHTTTILS